MPLNRDKWNTSPSQERVFQTGIPETIVDDASFDKKTPLVGTFFIGKLNGEAGIRTLETRKGLLVFETSPIDHSGTSPNVIITPDG